MGLAIAPAFALESPPELCDAIAAGSAGNAPEATSPSVSVVPSPAWMLVASSFAGLGLSWLLHPATEAKAIDRLVRQRYDFTLPRYTACSPLHAFLATLSDSPEQSASA